MTDTLEHTARRIAERGRVALVQRLRPAFEEAAAAHADVLKLDPEQIESMVQRAADRADGLQWRRALASVATEELGISLGEALSHPAVARAQAIVGAPSYEESLEKLGAEEPAENGDEKPAEQRADPATEEHPAAGHAEEEGRAAEDEDEEDEEEHPHAEDAEDADEEDEQDELEEDEGPLRLPAIHLGGIADLAPAEADIALLFSDQGLDIVRGVGDLALGRLSWTEITALDVPVPRGVIRRRRQAQAHIVVRTAQGDASFEIPGISTEELEQTLAPMREHLRAAG